MRKAFKYFLFIIIVSLFIASYFILSTEQQTSDDEWKSNIPHCEVSYQNRIRVISNTADSPDNVAVVFIHGAPGESQQFQPYLSSSILIEKAQLYAIDRPGYGHSDYGNPNPSISDQANIIHDVINAKIDSSTMIILVSHSYGGPIAAYMGLIAPHRYHAHLMLCPVIDPVSEPMFWVADAPLWWPFKYFSSGAMKVSAHEKLNHIAELSKLEHKWLENQVKTKMVQGAKDWLAPIENAEFVNTHFPNNNTEVIILSDDSHFIPFNKQSYVESEILKLMQ